MRANLQVFGSAEKSAPQASGFAMSVDVEDYFQVWAFSKVIDRRSWDGFAPRVEGATRRVLDLLDSSGAKATFFVLGWVAERAPGLIGEIVSRGHELASHGYDHAKVFDLSPDEFEDDVTRTKRLLEDISGLPVIGYRAPGFSIDARTPWAYEILGAAGYQYSSSAHPIAHDHYGDPNGARDPFFPLKQADFCEAPVATARLFGRQVSCAGGGWFRAAPYAVSKRLLQRARATLKGPVIFYFHPWEIDAAQPHIKSAPLRAQLRHYLNLSGMERKLSRLIGDFPWQRIDESIGVRSCTAAV